MAVIQSVTEIIRRSVISNLVSAGLGSNAIIRELGTLGLSYRRVNMLADIRSASGLMKLEKTISTISASIPFPRYAMVESTLRRNRRYRVYGKLELNNALTGEHEIRNVSWYTNTRDSKEGWARDFLSAYERETYEGSMYAVDLTVSSVEHQSGWKY